MQVDAAWTIEVRTMSSQTAAATTPRTLSLMTPALCGTVNDPDAQAATVTSQ